MSQGAHPFFVSPIAWHASFAEGQARARAAGRPVFVVHGGRSCAGTRQLVERTLAKEELSEFVAGNFEPVVSDADAPEPITAALVGALAEALKHPTPLCLYVTADEPPEVVHATAGGRPPAVLLNDMLTARAKADARARRAG